MKQKLNKCDLTAAVALACGLPKELAARAVDTTVTSITHALAQGEDVRITGFGTFRTRTRPERQVRNPRTGCLSMAPESRHVRFVPGSALRDAVKQE
ncbi:MAG: HU family DNA-binding protein [Candidatus Thiodiazotropha sp.]